VDRTNLGDIIIDGDDIFGDGVNIAARLETLAEPGGICVSRVVRDQVASADAVACGRCRLRTRLLVDPVGSPAGDFYRMFPGKVLTRPSIPRCSDE
jgi:hypothetical protein